MRNTKQISLVAVMVMAPAISMAAQSVTEWDCGSDGYRIGMAEDIASNASITITIDGGTAENADRSADIAAMVELDGTFTCPPTTSLSVTIDSSSYNAAIE